MGNSASWERVANACYPPPPAQILAERLALYFQAYTLYSSVRPFGLSAILAGWDSPISIDGSDTVVERKSEGVPQLYMVEPSGTFWVRSLLFVVFPALTRVLTSDVLMHRATAGVRLARAGSWQRRRLRSSRSTR